MGAGAVIIINRQPDVPDAREQFGDATGLGVLVEAYIRARRAGRRFAVVGMTDRTERLLRASRLDRALVLRDGSEAVTVAPLTA